MGRTAELATLAEAITKKRAVVSGVSGAGRTALMRAAANEPAAAVPGGVVRLDGVDSAGTALGVAGTSPSACTTPRGRPCRRPR